MAESAVIKDLGDAVKALLDVDKDKLIRPSLGDLSLSGDFKEMFNEILKMATFSLRYAKKVNNSNVSQFSSLLKSTVTLLHQQANRGHDEFASQRNNFIQGVKSNYEQLLMYYPQFITAAVDAIGLLDIEKVQAQFEDNFRKLEETKKAIEDFSEKKQQEAKKIEERARQTAAKVSVDAAQEQFKEAAKSHSRKILFWGGLSALSIAGFFWVAFKFFIYKPPAEWTWQVVYYSTIKVTILMAIGTVSVFCSRTLRAYIHMREHNLHRSRLANSMQSLVDSATIPEHRDLILMRLVDALASFGSSGLLHKGGGDDINIPKIALDSIIRRSGDFSGK